MHERTRRKYQKIGGIRRRPKSWQVFFKVGSKFVSKNFPLTTDRKTMLRWRNAARLQAKHDFAMQKLQDEEKKIVEVLEQQADTIVKTLQELAVLFGRLGKVRRKTDEQRTEGPMERHPATRKGLASLHQDRSGKVSTQNFPASHTA